HHLEGREASCFSFGMLLLQSDLPMNNSITNNLSSGMCTVSAVREYRAGLASLGGIVNTGSKQSLRLFDRLIKIS
ncbi:hypothetical protein Bpfe_026401, partial [Biomphalaria pfeifferi]